MARDKARPLAVVDCWLNLPGVEGKPAKEWVHGLTVYPPLEGSILKHIQVPVRVTITKRRIAPSTR